MPDYDANRVDPYVVAFFDRGSLFLREVEDCVRVVDPEGRALAPLLKELDWYRSALGRLRTSYLRPSPVLVVPYSTREERHIRKAARLAGKTGPPQYEGSLATAGGEATLKVLEGARTAVGRNMLIAKPLLDVGRDDEYYLDVMGASARVLVIEYGKHRDSVVTGFIRRVPAPVAVILVVPPENSPDRACDEVRESWARRGVEVPEGGTWIYAISEDSASFDHALGNLLARVADELAGRERDPLEAVRRLVEQFRERCRPVFEDFEKAIRPELHELRAVEEALPSQLVQHMIPDDAHLQTDVRHRLRLKMFSMTPLWCFPYRSLLGSLILTTGAWDRILLLPVSKIGSWLAISRSVVKNVRDLRSMARRFSQTAVERCKWEAASRLLPTLRHLHVKLWKLTSRGDGEQAYEDELTPEAVAVSGLDAIAERVRGTLEQAVERVSPSSFIAVLTGALATGLFVWLMSAPVYAAYDAYLAAWQRSILQGDEVAWTDFHPVRATVLAVAFLYSAAPAFVLALLALSFATRRSAVQAAVQMVRNVVKEALDEATSKGLVRVEVRAPKLQALIQLRRLLWSSYLPDLPKP